MNDQPMPTNPAGAGEVPANVRPEGMQSASGETAAWRPEVAPAPVPETAPNPGTSAGTPPASQLPSRLSAADVAAAIAAVPGGPPQVSGGGVVPTPVVAEDVDVIEPEWVSKAEEQVRMHAGDPYGEEEAIQELQEDYLQKRYGMNVADPNKGNDGGAAGKPGAA